MVRIGRVLSALAATVPLVACLADLPGPLACPPAAVHPMSDCAAVLAAGPAGCQPGAHACFDSTRSGCNCQASECAPPKEACFPDGECPAKVTTSGARCLRVAADATNLAVNEGCACGCPACMQICDGKGPTIAVKLPMPPTSSVGPMTVRLPDDLPDKGTLGLYVRYRGQSASLVVGVANAAAQGNGRPLAFANATPDFVDQTFDGMATWATSADKPQLVAFLAQQGPTAVEIDCVIPYVTATAP